MNPFIPVSVLVVACRVCWSFSLGIAVNPGHPFVFAGVYGFPRRKFLICVVPHINCMQLSLSWPRAEFVNWEMFSNVAGFFSYLFWMSSSHTPNSIFYLAERLKLQASSLWLLAYSIIVGIRYLYKKKRLLGLVVSHFFLKII